MVDHSDGTQRAMRRMLRDPGQGSGGASSACLRTIATCSSADLLQVVGVLVFEVTAREDENAQEDGTALAKARTGVKPTEAMETMALTIAHRPQESTRRSVATRRRTGRGD